MKLGPTVRFRRRHARNAYETAQSRQPSSAVGRVNEHLSAGADHVCVQVLTANPNEYPRQEWRRIAAALRQS